MCRVRAHRQSCRGNAPFYFALSSVRPPTGRVLSAEVAEDLSAVLPVGRDWSSADRGQLDPAAQTGGPLQGVLDPCLGVSVGVGGYLPARGWRASLEPPRSLFPSETRLVAVGLFDTRGSLVGRMLGPTALLGTDRFNADDGPDRSLLGCVAPDADGRAGGCPG